MHIFFSNETFKLATWINKQIGNISVKHKLAYAESHRNVCTIYVYYPWMMSKDNCVTLNRWIIRWQLVFVCVSVRVKIQLQIREIHRIYKMNIRYTWTNKYRQRSVPMYARLRFEKEKEKWNWTHCQVNLVTVQLNNNLFVLFLSNLYIWLANFWRNWRNPNPNFTFSSPKKSGIPSF